MNNENTPLEFPCEFPIKVMGPANQEFRNSVFEIIQLHIPELSHEVINEKPSRNSKYVSLTITITAHSRDQLDRIYRQLHACELVLMTL